MGLQNGHLLQTKSQTQDPKLQEPRSIIQNEKHVFWALLFWWQDDVMTGSPKWHTNIGRGKTILDPMRQNLGGGLYGG